MDRVEEESEEAEDGRDGGDDSCGECWWEVSERLRNKCIYTYDSGAVRFVIR